MFALMFGSRFFFVGQLYEGGFFKAKLEFPKDFPNNPPTMTFVSEMFHPNGERFAWLGLAWLGLAWLGLAWLGLAWLGLAGLSLP